MLASRRPLRGLRLALALSLGINLFALTFAGGMAWRHWDKEEAATVVDDAGERPSLRGVLRQVIATLPSEDAMLVREAFAARLPELVMLRRQSVQATWQVRADIADRRFDVDKTRADMLASREVRQKMAAVVQQTLLDVLPKMSDAGRSGLAACHLLPATRN